MLTKSDYIKYIQCRKYLWLHKNKPELIDEEDKTREIIFKQGYEVEEYAQELFEGGVRIDERPTEAKEKTKELIEKGQKIIFQVAAGTDEILAIADIFKFNEETKKWDIYEVKSTTTPKPHHISDLAFQKTVFTQEGYDIGQTYLIYLAKKYVRDGDIDPKKLFVTENISEDANNNLSIVEQDIPKAIKTFTEKNEFDERVTGQCKNPYPCPFMDYCWKKLPEYPVQKIKRITPKKLDMLFEYGVEAIEDVPDDFELTEIQQNQVISAKKKEVVIDKKAIEETLNKLTFPLYFLDYETFAPAIPLFDGTHPYQQVCFQYSLHVMQEDGTIEHFEYLSKDKENPIPGLLKQLKSEIGPQGSVIVWNKTFESGRNKDMGEMYPEYKTFMEDVNDRIFDLKDIFSNQLYVHPDFKGSCSIKDILPVLAPHLSYKELNIQKGDTASLKWYQANFDDSEDKEQVFKDLLKYCKLDTLAMVEIYKKIKKT